jgi:methylated-DNA-[protein]-cysteine S-methyltransferase
MSSKKDFSTKVYNLCKKIPRGKVTTYKEIAKALNTKAYRAVGNALRNNPTPIIVPCHRVVKTDSSLGGFSGKLNNPKKTRLLKEEGIEIKDNKILNFEKRLFSF